MANNKNVYGKKLVTPVGRMSYPHVFKKVAGLDANKAPKYEATLYVPKTQDVKAFLAEADRVAKEAFGSKYKGLDKLKNNPLKDGDESNDPNAKGCWIIRAKTGNRPGIVDRERRPIEEDDDQIYGGVFARLSVTPGSYDVSGSWGVTWFLNGVQKVKDGERFGGGGFNAEEDFDDISEEDADSGARTFEQFTAADASGGEEEF